MGEICKGWKKLLNDVLHIFIHRSVRFIKLRRKIRAGKVEPVGEKGNA